MKYRVVTRVVEECIYEVEAEHPKAAEIASIHATPVSTQTLQEDTMDITPIEPPRRAPPPHAR